MGPEEVRFQSGGEECAGWLFLPEGVAGAVPCVVLASGLTCVREQRLDAFGERFAKAGFAALAFDYRGFGASAGSPRFLVGAGRQRADWRAALDYVRGLEIIDRGRIAIWGFSLGGAHVQWLSISEPELAAAICVAPVVDGRRTLLYVGGAAHLARLGKAGIRDRWRALRGREPYWIPAAGPSGSDAVLAYPGALEEFEAVTPPDSNWRNQLCARVALAPPYRLARKATRIPRPILYCIAEHDRANPPALGTGAARRAPAGELRLYPGGHFAPLYGETFERVVADQVVFLRRHLGGGSAPG